MAEASPADNTENEIILTLILLNDTDCTLGMKGLLRSDEVRSCIVDIVVDTSVSHLCLPIEVIQQLGLKKVGRANTETNSVDSYGWVRFDIEGEPDSVYRCLELPSGQMPKLGRIPLEDKGLEPDLENRCLRKVPIRV
ncbi:MAG: aspartyl protease [Cyanobacteria bacterium P01_D01_bin.1]